MFLFKASRLRAQGSSCEEKSPEHRGFGPSGIPFSVVGPWSFQVCRAVGFGA